MITWRDMTFCDRTCGNVQCERNRVHTEAAPRTELISWSAFLDCDRYIGAPPCE